jgi:hypothetical protein
MLKLASAILGIILLVSSIILIVLPFTGILFFEDSVFTVLIAFIGILMAIIGLGFIFNALTKQ